MLVEKKWITIFCFTICNYLLYQISPLSAFYLNGPRCRSIDKILVNRFVSILVLNDIRIMKINDNLRRYNMTTVGMQYLLHTSVVYFLHIHCACSVTYYACAMLLIKALLVGATNSISKYIKNVVGH